MSTIAAVLAFFFLEGTLRVVVVVGLLLVDVVEIYIWFKWRNRKAMTGAEAMVGRPGEAITRCDPTGQVKVMGQIWNASANEPIEAGDHIEVTATEGLRLHVARR